MSTEQGTVTKVSGDKAWVRTRRSSMCDGCKSQGVCHSLGGTENMEAEALNSAGAKDGDRVILKISSGALWKISFLFYMIPVIFLNQWRNRLGNGPLALERATSKAAKESGAALGFSSAVGAFGGFFIPGSYGVSITLTGGVQAALFAFVAFYASCIAITWWYYARHGAEAPC